MGVIAAAMVGMIAGWLVGIIGLILYALWLHFRD